MSRAHILSLQQRHLGSPPSLSPFGPAAGAFADQPQRMEPLYAGGGLHPGNPSAAATGSQISGFGRFPHQQQQVQDQACGGGGGVPSLGFGSVPRGQGGAPSEAATSFPGFGGVGAASSAASPTMSAWPADQKLVMAMAQNGPGDLNFVQCLETRHWQESSPSGGCDTLHPAM